MAITIHDNKHYIDTEWGGRVTLFNKTILLRDRKRHTACAPTFFDLDLGAPDLDLDLDLGPPRPSLAP